MAPGQRQLPPDASDGCVSLLFISWEPMRSWVRALHTHGSLSLRPQGGLHPSHWDSGRPFSCLGAYGRCVGVFILRFLKLSRLVASPSGECWSPTFPAPGSRSGWGKAGFLWGALAHPLLLSISLSRVWHPSAPRVLRRVKHSAK